MSWFFDRFRSKVRRMASVKMAEKIAKEAGVRCSVSLLDGGRTLRINHRTFPVVEIEELTLEDYTSAHATISRALGVKPAILISEHMSNYKRAWAAWQRGGDELLMKPIFKATELQEAVVTALENANLQSNKNGRQPAATA